jgi:hypothetical protein
MWSPPYYWFTNIYKTCSMGFSLINHQYHKTHQYQRNLQDRKKQGTHPLQVGSMSVMMMYVTSNTACWVVQHRTQPAGHRTQPPSRWKGKKRKREKVNLVLGPPTAYVFSLVPSCCTIAFEGHIPSLSNIFIITKKGRAMGGGSYRVSVLLKTKKVGKYTKKILSIVYY